MKNNQLNHRELLLKYRIFLANKVRQGFVIVEKNDKLPFAVLSKKRKNMSSVLNFTLFCATLGLWLLPWFYINRLSAKDKMILVAIDEDGNVFEDKCYS